MNGKIKAAMIVVLVLGFVASAIYIAPTLAYMNGTTDQTRDRDQDQDRTRDRICTYDCVSDGSQDRNQTRTRLHLQECVQNQQFMEPAAWQYQHEHQYRYGNMGSA